MKAILFGNRGSRPIGASEDNPWQRYGGDTTCVGVICGDQIISLDTGSAFYKWGYTLEHALRIPPPYKIAILYSHYHDDHTKGLPQAPQLFNEANKISFFGPSRRLNRQGYSLREVFKANASEPANPDLIAAYKAKFSFSNLRNNKIIEFENGTRVSWLPVQHGQIKSCGYRIEHKGQTLCMISDTHHDVDAKGRPVLNPDIVNFISRADAVIYDSHFTDAFFEKNAKQCQEWGHSTGEHGVRLAEAARVPIVVAHHYDPRKIDAVLDSEMADLRTYGKNHGVAVIAAQPSLCLDFKFPRKKRVPFAEMQTTPALRQLAIAGELTL